MDHDLTKNGDAAPDQDPVELAAQEAVKRALLQQSAWEIQLWCGKMARSAGFRRMRSTSTANVLQRKTASLTWRDASAGIAIRQRTL